MNLQKIADIFKKIGSVCHPHELKIRKYSQALSSPLPWDIFIERNGWANCAPLIMSSNINWIRRGVEREKRRDKKKNGVNYGGLDNWVNYHDLEEKE